MSHAKRGPKKMDDFTDCKPLALEPPPIPGLPSRSAVLPLRRPRPTPHPQAKFSAASSAARGLSLTLEAGACVLNILLDPDCSFEPVKST